MKKLSYDVADGVEIVNGEPVPENRQVSLTEREALFDLAMGRIIPPKKEQGKPAEGKKSTN